MRPFLIKIVLPFLFCLIPPLAGAVIAVAVPEAARRDYLDRIQHSPMDWLILGLGLVLFVTQILLARQALTWRGDSFDERPDRWLSNLAQAAEWFPLLGLLGTVFGIIRAFSDIATAETTGRTEMLSHGISEALYCTAFGLSVAIPAVILHLYFVSRVDRLVIQIDMLGQEVVNTISAEAMQEAGQSRRNKKSAA